MSGRRWVGLKEVIGLGPIKGGNESYRHFDEFFLEDEQ